ncbi:MAG: hypothetical protein ABL903_16170 [Methylococcales bacterium]
MTKLNGYALLKAAHLYHYLIPVFIKQCLDQVVALERLDFNLIVANRMTGKDLNSFMKKLLATVVKEARMTKPGIQVVA